MTEAAPDLGLDERLEPRRVDDADRSHSSKELPLFAALHCVNELIGTAIAHVHFSVLAHAAHDARRPLRLHLQAPAGRGKGCLADAVAAHLSAVLITEDLARWYDHHGEVAIDPSVEQGWLYSLAPTVAPLAPVLAEALVAAIQARRALRRTA